MDLSIDSVKALLSNGIEEAQELIKEPSKVDDILASLENTLREVPAVGETLSDVPLMISMIKGYITKEYTDVSPKVIATMVAAILYLIKKKDIVPDNIPVLGIADDLAVLGLALKLSEPELAAFKAFRDGQGMEEPVVCDEQESEEAAICNEQEPEEAVICDEQEPEEAAICDEQEPEEAAICCEQEPEEAAVCDEQEPEEAAICGEQEPEETAVCDEQPVDPCVVVDDCPVS